MRSCRSARRSCRSGLRGGRFVGRAVVTRRDGVAPPEHELVAGPARHARRAARRIGARPSSTSATPWSWAAAAGGSACRSPAAWAASLVDLRDVPLRLPGPPRSSPRAARRRGSSRSGARSRHDAAAALERRPRRPRRRARAAAHASSRPNPVTWFPLRPGDRPLVGAGRDRHWRARRWRSSSTTSTWSRCRPRWSGPTGGPARRWTGRVRRAPVGRRRGPDVISGELLFELGGRWRVATGESGGLLEAPVERASCATSRPASGIALQVAGGAIDGVRAVGAPARGRLEVAGGRRGDVRAARPRRRAGGRDPRRRRPRRRRDADPGAGDGDPRHRRRCAHGEGPARLRGVRGAPAREPPSPAAVRGPRPRRRDPAPRRLARPCRPGRARRPRRRDRRRSAAAALRSDRRRAAAAGPRARARPAGRRGAAARAAGPGAAGVRQFRGGVRSGGRLRAVRRGPAGRRSRSATWSDSSRSRSTAPRPCANTIGYPRRRVHRRHRAHRRQP